MNIEAWNQALELVLTHGEDFASTHHFHHIYVALDQAEERGEKRGFKNGCETTKDAFTASDELTLSDGPDPELQAEIDAYNAANNAAPPQWKTRDELLEEYPMVADECQCEFCQGIDAVFDEEPKVNAHIEGENWSQYFEDPFVCPGCGEDPCTLVG